MTGRILFSTGAVLTGASAALWSLIWFPREVFISNEWGVNLMFTALFFGVLCSVLLSFTGWLRLRSLDHLRKRTAFCIPGFLMVSVMSVVGLIASLGPLIALFAFVSLPVLLVTMVWPVWGPRERSTAGALSAYFVFNHGFWFFLGPLPILQFTHALGSLALMLAFTWPLLVAMHSSKTTPDRIGLPLPPPVEVEP